MARSAIPLVILALALPIAVEVPPRDSSFVAPAGFEPPGFAHHQPGTQLTVAGGGGTYGLVERGCEGEILRYTRIRHRDVAGEIEQRFPGPLSAGVRGGVLDETLTPHESQPPGNGPSTTRENHYANPYLRLDSRWAGIGGGPIFAEQPFLYGSGDPFHARFSGNLRLGPSNLGSLRLGWMEGLPLLADGGYFTIGAQVSMWRDLEGYFGLSAVGPDDGPGALVRLHWWMSPITAVHFSGRFTTSNALTEDAFAFGFTIRTPPPREPEP